MCNGSDIFLGFLAVLFPPLPVWVKCGLCSADAIINILLCMLGYVPGLLHSWYIIAKFPGDAASAGAAEDYERLPQNEERVTYVFVNQQPTSAGGRQPPKPAPPPQHHHHQPGGAMDYGTAGGDDDAAAAAGSSSGAPAPPSYAEAVKGDHKVQTQD
ncbi:hypothetical protein F4780DRAFT_751371 [Xylariomycetidae sp. FL0641]|nr:hypothetical protein F4780DRAFT_751371 [Xylariomycetidae sp. FL0641]